MTSREAPGEQPPGADRFDLEHAWVLDPAVSVRPEPFGALLYHFGTRRLSFLKDARLRTVVTELADHPSARSACLAAGVTPQELPQFALALARLVDSAMLRPRGGPSAPPVKAAP